MILIVRLRSGESAKNETVIKPTAAASTVSPTPLKPAYQSVDLEKDYKRITSGKTLAASDSQVRNKLISQLGGKSGVLNTTSNFSVEYVAAPNQFMVEIKTNSAALAKTESENWFTSQGLSLEGICNLPVTFYLNYQVNLYYKEHNLQFNPVPDGC